MNDVNGGGVLGWLGEILAGLAIAVTVAAGWFNDRMRISSAISELRQQNARLESKFDIMLEMYKQREGNSGD